MLPSSYPAATVEATPSTTVQHGRARVGVFDRRARAGSSCLSPIKGALTYRYLMGYVRARLPVLQLRYLTLSYLPYLKLPYSAYPLRGDARGSSQHCCRLMSTTPMPYRGAQLRPHANFR